MYLKVAYILHHWRTNELFLRIYIRTALMKLGEILFLHNLDFRSMDQFKVRNKESFLCVRQCVKV
jgi:hypothetical protein